MERKKQHNSLYRKWFHSKKGHFSSFDMKNIKNHLMWRQNNEPCMNFIDFDVLKKYFSIIISCRAVYGLKIIKIKPKDLPSSSALLFFHVRETNICGLCISPMHIRKRCANTKEKSWEVFEQRRKLALFLSYWTKFCALSFQFF